MKTILFSILILFSINGFAFNWKKVFEDTKGNSYYVDVDNIKKHNGLVYYWVLIDFLEPFTNNRVGSGNSLIGKYKVNCVEEKQTWLNVTFYSQSMGRGRIIGEDTPNKILYPKPKEVAHTVMKSACNY